MNKWLITIFLIIGSLIILVSIVSISNISSVCAGEFPLCPTPTDTEEPSPTPTDTEEPSPTPTDTEIPSQTPTETVIPSQTPTETVIPSLTPTNTEEPSGTPTTDPTKTVTPTGTIVPSLTPSITPQRSPTPTFTWPPPETNTPTGTLQPSLTPTITLQPSLTPTITLMPSLTPTGTLMPSLTPTGTLMPSPTQLGPTDTPFPPQAAEANGRAIPYSGTFLGKMNINGISFDLYQGINAPDGSLMLPSYNKGAALYEGIIWLHRMWNTGWINIEIGDIVIINNASYKITGSNYIDYGIYPKVSSTGIQYIATCYSNEKGEWAGVQLYQIELIRKPVRR